MFQLYKKEPVLQGIKMEDVTDFSATITDYFSSLIMSERAWGGCNFDFTKTVIAVEQATPDELMQEAFRMTAAGSKHFEIPMHKAMMMEHSPIRTVYFWVKMYNIPNYVHIHFRTHNKFAAHIIKDDFVQTGRIDRSLRTNEDRWANKDHGLLLNVQDLINMSGVRLCEKADGNINYLMSIIVYLISHINEDIAAHLVPKCVSSGGYCNEGEGSCKKNRLKLKQYSRYHENYPAYCLP